MTDEELLALVADERKRSVGFDHDSELSSARQKALEYAKGQMDDMPALQNRSKAVSMDVADAVETILPDLVEIFTGGSDVAVFSPVGPEDEEAAQQETDYINHVVFAQNDGFMLLYTMFKDACLSKTGVATWWWEEYEEPAETFEGKSIEELAVALQNHGERVELASPLMDGEMPVQTVDFTIRAEKRGKVCVQAVPPEDFTVSRDTVRLSDTPYCAMRSRPRAYELLKEGYDAEQVAKLPAYGVANDENDQARDSAGEHDEGQNGGLGDHRQVEIIAHYIRTNDGLYRVVTDGSDSFILEREEVQRIQFAAITPYIVTHRFYGESIADKLIEIQKINTALTRMGLDSGYFALNQRNEVAMDRANEWTVADLLANEPGRPVRSKSGDAVRPLQSGALTFDVFGALEYFKTQAEQRTGIVRNAQGLNPDTLHDTAKGAMALMTAAQKRVRLIARIFAETGVKELFLGVHALIRENATAPMKARLRNKWVDIDPTSWGSRSDMTIEIGVGAGGDEQQMMALSRGLEVMERLIDKQGGLNGPMVTADNAYALLKRFYERGLKFKSADPFLTDPAEAPPQEPKPDPAMMEAQAKLQMEQQKAQAQMQFQAQKAEADMALARERAGLEMQLERDKQQAQLSFQREQAAAELTLKREEMAMEYNLKREANALNAQAKVQAASTSIGGPEMGGEPG
jgi:hypothetical protein